MRNARFVVFDQIVRATVLDRPELTTMNAAMEAIKCITALGDSE